MKGKGFPGSSPVLFALAAALASVSTAWWPPPLRGETPREGAAQGLPEDLEVEGDRSSSLADPVYRRALESLAMAERLSRRLGDAAGGERALRLRAGLLATLLDARAFAALGEKSPELPETALPLTVPEAGGPEAGGPDEESLRALSKFLGEAGRAYFRSEEKEGRDLPLLFEALSLSERLLGDIHQARADHSYRLALAQGAHFPAGRSPGGPSPGGGPEAIARARAGVVRLKLKLRDFGGARAALAGNPVHEELLRGAERLEHLRTRRDLALFAGARADARAIELRLSDLGEKAEEVAMPSTPLRSFLAGSSADLARTASTLLAAVSARRLSARDRLLAGYLAGQALLESGEPAAAVETLEPLLGRLPPEDPWLAAGIQAWLADARDRSGDYEGAVAAFRGARRSLAGLSGVERYRSRLAIGGAAALFGLGQLEAARRAALEVLEEESLPGDLRVRCRILLAGILQVKGGDSRQGLDDALAALALAERERPKKGLEKGAGGPEASVRELEALIHAHTSNIHLKRARLLEEAAAERGAPPAPEAAALRREALHAARLALKAASGTAGAGARDQPAGPSRSLERLRVSCAANLGEILLEAGDLAGARREVEGALDAARKLRAFESEWRGRWYLARILALEGDPAAADREMEEAARIVEGHRARIIDADRKAGFMARKVGLYEAMVRRAFEKEDGREAFRAAERARARSFVESLGLRFLLLAADRDRAIYREYLSLYSRTEDRARGGGELYGIRAAGSYEELREKLEALRKKIRRSPTVSPLVRALVEGDPAGVEAVQRDLEPGERLVEYFGAEGMVAVFLIGPRSFSAFKLKAARRDIERAAERFAESKAGDAALAARLGKDLLEPLLERLAEGEPDGSPGGTRDGQDREEPVHSLIIVPAGALHRVPFEALIAGGRHLIERYAVSYLPTASVLKYLEKPGAEREAPQRLLAFVDPNTDYDGDGRPDLPPLSGARAEVEAIAPLFREPEVLIGLGASEEACLSLLPGREIVHFACHGEFFPARPLDSRLYLTSTRPADGLLRASEIYGIDLRGSRLVALSGCETGKSDVGAGEDPVGIGMAFLHTGAAALLVSLWKVEDQATAKLMRSFYAAWLSGKEGSRARALRKAKLGLLEGGGSFAPRHWASFVLIGPR